MGRFHVGIRDNQNPNAGGALDVIDCTALFIEQERRDIHRHHGSDLAGALLSSFLLQQPEYGQCQGFGVTNCALAGTARADYGTDFSQTGAQSLSGHLQQPESGDAAYLNPGTVDFQCIPYAIFHCPLVLVGAHVNEVNDHQTTHVPKSQLSGNLVSGFQIGL